MQIRTSARRITETTLAALMTFAMNSIGPAAEAAASAESASTTAKMTSAVSASGVPTRCWSNPTIAPKAALLCIHGLGLNSEAYSDFASRMASRAILTYAIDVRGFGEWQKSNGNSKIDFDATLNDIKSTLEKIRQDNPGMPVFLLGESMGGAIVLRACSLYPELIDGLISSVPSGDRFEQGSSDLSVAMHALRGLRKQYDMGKGVIQQGTEVAPDVQNTLVQAVWESDPLNRMDLSPLQLIQFQKFMDGNHKAAEKISQTPILMVQGTLDHLVKPTGTWEIFNELATRKKTFIAFPSEHLIFEYGQAKSNSVDTDTVDITSHWIYTHSPQSQGTP